MQTMPRVFHVQGMLLHNKTSSPYVLAWLWQQRFNNLMKLLCFNFNSHAIIPLFLCCILIETLIFFFSEFTCNHCQKHFSGRFHHFKCSEYESCGKSVCHSCYFIFSHEHPITPHGEVYKGDSYSLFPSRHVLRGHSKIRVKFLDIF